MNLGDTVNRWLSPALFALVALCFLLPWATVSCDGAETTFTGVQLITTRVPDGGTIDEAQCSADIGTCIERSAGLATTVAFALALIGLALGLVGVVRGPGWCALGGMVALAWSTADSWVLGP